MRSLKSNADRALLAATGVARVVSRPLYGLLAIVIAIVFAIGIYFLINIQFYGPLMTSSLPIGMKSDVVAQLLQTMAGEFVTSLNGALLLVFALLQGAALSILAFTMRRNLRDGTSAAGQAGSSGIAAVAAAVGLGCVPCGTSLILPLVTVFFSGAAAATAANYATIIVLIVALLLTIYSLYKTGYIAYAHTEAEKYDNRKGQRNETQN